MPSGLDVFDVYFRRGEDEYLDPKQMNVFADVRIGPGERWPGMLRVIATPEIYPLLKLILDDMLVATNKDQATDGPADSGHEARVWDEIEIEANRLRRLVGKGQGQSPLSELFDRTRRPEPGAEGSA
jgi:hypothetical protein